MINLAAAIGAKLGGKQKNPNKVRLLFLL